MFGIQRVYQTLDLQDVNINVIYSYGTADNIENAFILQNYVYFLHYKNIIHKNMKMYALE